MAHIEAGALPTAVDLRPQCPPIYDQGELGCHDDKTEVLTERGFRLFAELDGSERLATVNPETAALSFELPIRLIRFPYRGKLHCVAGESLNFKVTPTHNMLLRKWNERSRKLNSHYQFVSAHNVDWYFGLMNRVRWVGENHTDVFTLPGVPHKHKPQRQPLDIPMAAWLRFLGLYVAEGTMLKRDQRSGTISYKIQIAGSKTREKAFIQATLADIGVSSLELDDRFTFQNRRIYEAMSSLGLEGVKAGEKFVPSFVFRLGAEMIDHFLEGHFQGDGSQQYIGTVRSHYTGSRRLADDLQMLAFLSGHETRLHIREARDSMTADGRSIRSVLPEHRVSVCTKSYLSVEKKDQWFTEDYDGDVFCAEVPTYHTLVTRREGKLLISGNSCTAHAWAGLGEFLLKKERLPEFTPSRLAIYWDERQIEGDTADDTGASLTDGAHVTSTNGCPHESLWPYDISQFAVQPPANVVADGKQNLILAPHQVHQDLVSMKAVLANGYPIALGFSVFESFESEAVTSTGIVPMPGKHEQLLGGHAVLCVGYNDSTRMFIGRNSWGSWGLEGYFDIPYQYWINPRLASDFWSATKVT
jgi:hypothetical protein